MYELKMSIQGLTRQGRYRKIMSGLCFLILVVAGMLINMTTHQVHTTTSRHSGTIKAGDTLSGVVGRFGVSVQALQAANSLTHPNLISAGQTMLVPDGSTISVAWQQSDSYAEQIRQVFGPYGDGAVRVAMCESGLNPNAYNGVLGAAGLFQIIPGTFASTSYAGQSVYNPQVNIGAAYEVFARDGYTWREWACQP
jgi:LysM repeat protein